MDVKRQTMKKMVMAGLIALCAFGANAQQFKKGEAVEINKNLSNDVAWLNGRVVDLNTATKNYVVKGLDDKLYNIPFNQDQSWIRRPMQALNTSLSIKSTSCGSAMDVLKQKVVEEFETDFSEYDSVAVTFNSIEEQKSYRNTDPEFGKIDSEVVPFKIDITVRLVSLYKDGSQRKINWQFKRKYLLFQTKAGSCEVTMAEKEESLLSNI
jgi:hypothetical protein